MDNSNPNREGKIALSVIGINILILLCYQISIYYTNDGYAREITSALTITMHAFLAGILALITSVTRVKIISIGLAASVGVVLIVGMGTCAMF